jgi:hypothetical protein
MAILGQNHGVAMTRAERREAATVIRHVVDQVYAGELTASGPLVQRLEGVVIGLEALDGSSVPIVVIGASSSPAKSFGDS